MVGGCSNQPNYSPACPRIGDRAEIKLEVWRTGASPQQRRESSTCRLLVECSNRQSHRSTFTAYYVDTKAQREPAYTFTIDCGKPALRGKTIVRDLRGRVLSRGMEVRGFPVPFHDVCALDTETLMRSTRQTAEIEGGLLATAFARHRPKDGRWSAIVDVWSPKRNRECEYRQWQRWHDGDWLWTEVKQAHTEPRGLSFVATRSSK